MPKYLYFTSILALGLLGAHPPTLPPPPAPQALPQEADTLRLRVTGRLPACPMPVFRPAPSPQLQRELPRPDAPRVDTLLALLQRVPSSPGMPIVRSGCYNPLDTLARRNHPVDSTSRWRVY